MTSSETTFNDEELIARLRKGETPMANHYMDEAADRIEALTAERDDYAWKLNNANNIYTEMHVELEALTEQLAAAQQDAKEAEDYAEEVEKELNTCRMAQAVMDNTVADLEAKLAKAVDAFVDLARATLAEIKGESHE